MEKYVNELKLTARIPSWMEGKKKVSDAMSHGSTQIKKERKP
jgi:hypothetical protein